MKFPVLLLDHFLSVVSYPMEWLKKYFNLHILSKGGKYVYAQYPELGNVNFISLIIFLNSFASCVIIELFKEADAINCTLMR